MKASTLLLLAVCASACAGASTGPAAPASLPDVAWKDMDDTQRALYMEQKVMPAMQGSFRQFDPKEFDKLDCESCHGARAESGDFRMPNPDLPKLSAAEKFRAHMDTQPEMTRFMMEKVTPQMAALLAMPVYDPNTKQGFGCFGCHTEQP